MCGFLLISSCGPTLFTVAGHNVTLGGIMISQSVQKVIKENKEEPRQCAEGWDTLSITIPCEDNIESDSNENTNETPTTEDT